MARGLESRPRLVVQEFGAPLSVDLSREEIGALEVASRAWQGRLSLRGLPFTVTTENGSQLLYAKHVCGVVRLGSLELEVVPKFLSSPNTVDNKWRTALWRILTIADGSGVSDDALQASVAEAITFADLLADSFAASFRKGSSRGMPRQYDEVRGSGPRLLGSFDTTRLADWLARPWMIPYRFEFLTENTAAAQLLRWGAISLSRVVSSSRRNQVMIDIAQSLLGADLRRPNIVTVRRIRLGAQHQALRQAVKIAALVFEGQGIDHELGSAELGGFLWDSDAVYERFLFALCSRAAKHLGITADKSPIRFGIGLTSLTRNLHTTPDVVFRSRDRRAIGVVDAKYKRFGNQPEAADTYQVLAAAHATGCSRVGLAYPVADAASTRRRWAVDSLLGASQVEVSSIPLNLLLAETPTGVQTLVDRVADWVRTA
jgi:5-methylcytosine-specific restriction endonuclease McrBC regulatory subunit McrC